MGDRPPSVPLHLTSVAILGPDNAPLYVHAFTGPEDEMRAYHLAHAAVDVIEERSEYREQHRAERGAASDSLRSQTPLPSIDQMGKWQWGEVLLTSML